MKRLAELTYNSTCGSDTETIKLSNLLKLMIAYPEICANKGVYMGDLAKYYSDEDLDVHYLLTDLETNKLFTAVAAWLELYIRTGVKLSVQIARLSIYVDVGSDMNVTTISCSPTELEAFQSELKKGYLFNVYGFAFAKEFKGVTDENILHNMVVLKKVVALC